MKTFNKIKDSNRLYRVSYTENGLIEPIEFSLEDLFSDQEESELFYSMQEWMDDILDLKKSESMFIYFRDTKQREKALIFRIK